MIKKLMLLLTVNICLAGLVSHAQAPSNEIFKNPVSLVSPDVASLGKYGTYNVNHYTGTPNISIPLYEINEPGINVPISISYDGSGFMPNKNSSQVGQNWNLTAGGAITRTVRGVPDDYHDYNPTIAEEILLKKDKGYIWGIQNNAPSTYPAQSYVENLGFLTPGTTPVGFPVVATGETKVLYEYSPDIFSFNFMGHSGTFVMGNDGVVKVSADQPYKVDMSALGETFDLANKWSLMTDANIRTTSQSSIIMTAADGYKFYFGGKLNALEVSFSYVGITGRDVSGRSGVINAWYLTKVVCPDGTTVDFDYGTYTDAEALVLRRLGSGPGIWDENLVTFIDIRLSQRSYYVNYNFGTFVGSGSEYASTLNKSLVKMVYLKKIDTKLQTVTFNYLQKDSDTYPVYGVAKTYTTDRNDYYTSKLVGITVHDKVGVSNPSINGDDISVLTQKDFGFTYQNYGNATSGYRTYLTAVNANGSNYVFDYSRLSELPSPTTTGIDRWGYYNGQNSNQFFIKYTSCPFTGNPLDYDVNFNCTGQVRIANATTADIGMLNSITYPTGGKTTFVFEANRYKKVLKRKASAANAMQPFIETLSQEEYAGGCRIQKIINSPGTTTEYKYIKNYNVNHAGVSSGLLNDFAMFKFRLDLTSGQFYEESFDDNISKASSYGESHICYPEVVAITHDGTGGYTKYTYTNPDTDDYTAPTACPDVYEIGGTSTRIDAEVTSAMNQMKKMARISSRSAERGKISKEEVFNSSDAKVASTEYTYNTDPLRFNEKTVGYEKIFSRSMGGPHLAYFIQAFHIYNYHNNVSQVKKQTWVNGEIFTEITNMTYKSNSYPLLTKQTTTNSDNLVRETQYYYPQDRIGNPDYPSSGAMNTAFIVNPVIEEKNYKNSVLLTTRQNIYSDATGAGGYKLFTTKMQNHTISGSINNTYMNVAYYTDGNVKEVSKPNDMKIHYLWDYKKTFPIAEVKNAGSAADIAYTSFETNETWSAGGYSPFTYNVNAAVTSNENPSGARYYNLRFGGVSQPITRTLSSSQVYILSFWFKGSSLSVAAPSALTATDGETIKGWTFKQYKITGGTALTITGTGSLDELRLYPETATMQTFNYQPLWGYLSKRDENNNCVYFSYDGFGRLTLLHNKYQQVIKKYCYNFYGQVENCTTP